MTEQEALKVFNKDTEIKGKLKLIDIIKVDRYCVNCGSHDCLGVNDDFYVQPEMSYFCNKCKCSFIGVFDFNLKLDI